MDLSSALLNSDDLAAKFSAIDVYMADRFIELSVDSLGVGPRTHTTLCYNRQIYP